MPIRARRTAGLTLTAAVAAALTLAGVGTAAASPVSECTDIGRLKGSALDSCIHTLRLQAEAAGRIAEKANESYLEAKHAAKDAHEEASSLSDDADEAQAVAERSRARAAVVAAHLARTGGSAGQTAEVLLSGSGAGEVLYHLSRMSELTADTSSLADDAKRDQESAEDLSRRAALAADRLATEEAKAKEAYAKAKKTSAAARLLVAKAEDKRSPGSNAANVQAFKDLPADASVTQKVLAFARAQIGEPYVFGAAGPGSWDCSGLTMEAFAAAGKNIGGHGVNVQYRLARSKGLLVPYSQAQPGDLLFWGSGDYYHVAIYSGGGTMIEAPMPGRTVREVPVRTAELAPVVARFTA